MNILVIEDDPVFISIIEKMIGDIHCVTAVTSPVEGIELYTRNLHNHKKFDLIIHDICLPGMYGNISIQMIRLIENLLHINRIPIIVLSSDYNTDNINMCKNYSPISCLTKPVRSKELLEAISTLKKITYINIDLGD